MKTLEGWDKKALRDLATINYGKSPTEILVPDGPYPVVGTGGTERLGNDYLYEGDSIILGRKGSIDRVHFATGRFWTIDTAYYLSDFSESVPHWLFYFLQTIDLRQMNEATGVPSLSRDTLYQIEVPTPPKSEQTKIAEILTTVDRAIEQTEALIDKQQRIKTGLMQDLLTRGIDQHGNLRSEETHQFKDSQLGRIPVEWEVAALSRAVKLIKRGPSLSTNSENRGIIYLTSDNISETGELIWQTVKYLDARPESLNSILEIGDVILNCVNSEAQIGKTGFVDKLIGVTTTGFNNFGLSFKENVVFPKFIFYQLSYVNFQCELRKKIKPAINQSSFSSTDIADLPVIIPELEEQQLVADKIDSVSIKVQSLSKTLSKGKRLKTALMQDLLTGRKRVLPLLEAKGLVS